MALISFTLLRHQLGLSTSHFRVEGIVVRQGGTL
jgi:hypothetical protein